MALVSSTPFSRRILFGVSLASFLTTFALIGAAADAADQVTFVSQGGAYQKVTADTIACIAGGIAEAYYGKIPDYIS